MPIAAFVLGAVLAAAAPPAAPDRFDLPRGLRVRVGSTEGPVAGNVHGSDADALLIADGAGRIVRVPRAAVTRLEIYSGRKDHLVRGAVIGAAAGIAFGLVATRSSAPDPSCGCEEDWSPLATMLLATMGGSAGAVVGNVVNTDTWMAIPPERLRPAQPKGAVRITVRF